MNNTESESSSNRKSDTRRSEGGGGGVVLGMIAGAAIFAGASWLWGRLSGAQADQISSVATNSVDSPLRPQGPPPPPPPSSFNPDRVDVAGENDEAITCSICMHHKSNCVFEPCHHLSVCSQCAAKLTKCPVCRETISGKTTVFI